MSALQKIIDLKGSQAAVGKIVGRNQQAVAHWLAKGVPPEHVISLAKATDWVVVPHELRPDIYPSPTDGVPPKTVTTGATP